jgi:hypothetical protein
MTVARVSQGVGEVLRTNTAVNARVDQAVIETLRTSTAVKAQIHQALIEILRENEAETPLATLVPLHLIINT